MRENRDENQVIVETLLHCQACLPDILWIDNFKNYIDWFFHIQVIQEKMHFFQNSPITARDLENPQCKYRSSTVWPFWSTNSSKPVLARSQNVWYAWKKPGFFSRNLVLPWCWDCWCCLRWTWCCLAWCPGGQSSGCAWNLLRNWRGAIGSIFHFLSREIEIDWKTKIDR